MSRVTVVGGGLAGLLAAYRLLGLGHSVAVREAAPTMGGMIASLDLGGVLVDSGAEAYAVRGGAVAPLCAELGLEVAGPTGDPHVWWSHGIYPMAQGVLGIPASLDDPAFDALTDEERAIAGCDLELGPEVGADATTVGELVAARLGEAVNAKLVAPLTTGVYGSTPAKLSLALAPGLLAAVATEGSLVGAVAKIRRPGAASVEQPIGGMFRLIDVLVERITALGGDLRAGAAVASLARGESAGEPEFTVTTADGEALVCDRVVLATPAARSVALLGQVGQDLPTPDVKTARHVMIAATTAGLRDNPVGSGVLIGAADPSVQAKALTHYSAKWPWARAAAPEVEVLRVSYPPHIRPTRAEAIADASALTGVTIRDTDVLAVASLGWESMPVRIDPATRDTLLAGAAEAGVDLVGAWLDGYGIAAVVSGTDRVMR